MTPEITVALAVKDGEDYLAESIESVLAQEDVELELLILDNDSSDATADIARHYGADARVRYVRHARDLGPVGNLQHGLAEATGELYVPWAHDDVMLPGNLARKTTAMRASGAGMAFGPVITMRPDGTPTGCYPTALGDEPAAFRAPELFSRIVSTNHVPMPSVVLRTDAVRTAGGWDAAAGLCVDWALWLRLALRTDAVFVPEPLVRYREHAANGTASGWRDGGFLRDGPATIVAAFADPALPPGWRASRDAVIAGLLAGYALELARLGHVRHEGSPCPAYAALGRALMLSGAPAHAASFASAVEAAGLSRPRLPADVVASAPDDAVCARGLVAAFRALQAHGAAARFVVVAGEPEVDRAVAALGPALERAGELDVDLVVAAPQDVLAPGAIWLGPSGSVCLAAAEAAGVPALAYGHPELARLDA